MNPNQLKQIIGKVIDGLEGKIKVLSNEIESIKETMPTIDNVLANVEIKTPKYGVDWSFTNYEMQEIMNEIKPQEGVDYFVPRDGKDAEVTDELIERITNIVQSRIKQGRDGVNGKNGKDGRNGRDGNDGINGKNGIDGVDGSPDTPKEIVAKLNTVENAVDWKVLKNFDSIVNQDTLKRAVQTLENQARYLIQKQGTGSGISDISGLIGAGTGISFTGSGTSGSPYVVDNDGVLSLNTLTGAVTISAGSNVTFNTVGNNIQINSSGTPSASIDVGTTTIGGTGNPNEVLYIDGGGVLGSDARFLRNQTTEVTTIAGQMGASATVISSIDLSTTILGTGEGAVIQLNDSASGGYALVGAIDATTIVGEPLVSAMTAFDGVSNNSDVVVAPTFASMSHAGAVYSGSIGIDETIGIAMEQYSAYTLGSRDIFQMTSSASGENIFFATNVPVALTTGIFNWMGGYDASPLTSGSLNSTWGFGAGASISTGSSNTLIGAGAGNILATGSSNVFLGNSAGLIATAAARNVIIGAAAGSATGTSIVDMVIIGNRAGNVMTNTAIDNVYIGKDAGRLSTNGSSNTIIGTRAGDNITTGSSSVIIGTDAGNSLSTTSFNVVIGDQAATTGGGFNNAVIVGRAAGQNNQGDDVVFIGYQAGQSNTTATRNIGIGNNALSMSTGIRNIGIGAAAGGSITTGTENIMIGEFAGTSVTTSSDNIAIGYNALGQAVANTTNYSNTVLGVSAGRLTNGAENTLIGYRAGDGLTTANPTGSSSGQNVVIGANTGLVLGASFDNVIVGCTAAQSLVGENGNTIVGNDALQTSTSGQGNVIIGDDAAQATTTAGDVNVLIGSGANLTNSVNGSIGLGADVDVTASNTMIVGSETVPVNDFYFGEGIVSTTPSAISFNATGGSGTNISAADFTIAGGRGTGTGTGGHLIFQTAPAGSTGTTLGTLVTRFEITDDAKIGFFGVTPVIRQTTTSQTPATFAANSSGIVDDTATWNGYTIGDLVAILQAYGILT